MSFHHNNQQGYTLIELMVSLVLGLLITAAAIQLFITGQTSYRLQRSLASLQDNGSFGMNYLISDIRKANIGAPTASMNDQTSFSGLLLTESNADKPATATMSTTYQLANYLDQNSLYTSQAPTPAAGLSSSNVGVNSDQLTIQYVPKQVGYDCVGNQITATQVTNQVHILQRYFVRADTAGDKGLALACASASYYVDGSGAAYTSIDSSGNKTLDISTLKGNGQIIIPRVDYFHVLLSTSTGHFYAPVTQTYNDISTYLSGNCTTSTPGASCYRESWEDTVTPVHAASIRGIQIGLLVRATDSAGGNAAISQRNGQAFKVLDKSVTLNSTYNTDSKYLRQVMSQAITFRNAAGEGSI